MLNVEGDLASGATDFAVKKGEGRQSAEEKRSKDADCSKRIESKGAVCGGGNHCNGRKVAREKSDKKGNHPEQDDDELRMDQTQCFAPLIDGGVMTVCHKGDT